MVLNAAEKKHGANPTDSREIDDEGNAVCNRLKNVGFQLYAFAAVNPTLVIVLLRLPLQILRDFAEDIGQG